MPFEGTEKKLEILLRPGEPSLRERGHDHWTDLVHRSRAEVLSRISNDEGDAYLLSESSLFVHDRRMIMITCGRTRLVDAAASFLETVSRDSLESVIFERKNENFPDLQPSTFEQDVELLGKLVPGHAHVFGDAEGHHLSLFHLDRDFDPADDDETLEILMYGLDEAVRPEFHAVEGRTAADIRELLGLGRLFPGFTWDDHLFRPAGYSLNGIRDDRYVTVHVTPDDPGSYASFETSVPLETEALERLMGHLVEVFRPVRYDVVHFREGDPVPPGDRSPIHRESRRLGCGYRVHFEHYRGGSAADTARP